MDFLDALVNLFPAVAITAVLIRYLVEAGKKFKVGFVVNNPGRVQAALNAVAWLGMGIAAHYGVQGETAEYIRRITDAFPGLLGLLELVIPAFLSVLATKGVHELAKRTEPSPKD